METIGKPTPHRASPWDRLAIGAFSGVTSLALGVLLLLGLGQSGLVLPWRDAAWFAAGSFALGFLLLENPLLWVYTLAWKALRWSSNT